LRARPTALHETIFIADMLNPSLKSRFMQKFSRFNRILAGLVGLQISQLKNKDVLKIKTLKTHFL